MLTATYSLVTISTEQENARTGLAELQQYVHRTWCGLDRIDFALLEQSLNRLTQFDRFIHCRKIEAHLIPALRHADGETDTLISELDALSAKASSVLCAIDEQLADAFDLGSIQVTEISRLMEQYCHYL